MGYKMFDGKKLLRECRYMNGREELESVARTDLDYDEIDNWRSVSDAWSYLEFPEYSEKLFGFIGERECLYNMFIRILRQLNFPFFQCHALLYIPENDLPDFIEKCLADKEGDSIMWAWLEIWFNRIKGEGERQRFEDKAKWLDEVATIKVRSLVELFSKYGRRKTLMRWLCTNHHHDWPDMPGKVNIPKHILLLVEAVVAFDWDDRDFDKEFKEIDYLTFVALDVSRDGVLSLEMASDILAGYHHSLLDEFTICRIKEDGVATNWMRGFATVFKIISNSDLIADVNELYNKYRYFFEGYRGRAARHDFRHIRRMNFVMGAIEMIAEGSSLNPDMRRKLMEINAREKLRSRSIYEC